MNTKNGLMNVPQPEVKIYPKCGGQKYFLITKRGKNGQKEFEREICPVCHGAGVVEKGS
jgi:hypothetical protein